MVREIAKGGMGRVILARDLEQSGREVALKEISAPTARGGESAVELQRFMREAEALTSLRHPSIVAGLGLVVHHGSPLLVMEYIDGRSLAAELGEHGTLPVDRVARIGLALLGALGAAHRAGIVHRDVKPGNVLLAGDRAVLTDFGIAYLTHVPGELTGCGAPVGTARYMAPEQLDERHPSPAVDLWSLGVTLYHAVEGVPPFSADSLPVLTHAICHRPHRRPVRAGRLAAALDALLVKDPHRRASAEQAAEMLSAVLEGPARGGWQAPLASWPEPRTAPRMPVDHDAETASAPGRVTTTSRTHRIWEARADLHPPTAPATRPGLPDRVRRRTADPRRARRSGRQVVLLTVAACVVAAGSFAAALRWWPTRTPELHALETTAPSRPVFDAADFGSATTGGAIPVPAGEGSANDTVLATGVGTESDPYRRRLQFQTDREFPGAWMSEGSCVLVHDGSRTYTVRPFDMAYSLTPLGTGLYPGHMSIPVIFPGRYEYSSACDPAHTRPVALGTAAMRIGGTLDANGFSAAVLDSYASGSSLVVEVAAARTFAAVPPALCLRTDHGIVPAREGTSSLGTRTVTVQRFTFPDSSRGTISFGCGPSPQEGGAGVAVGAG
ncbi:serine/threonine-protein kinase [Kitasatospora sp. NPDC007106]|uniref:serine/threonine-protein kinase n=1 Tax=Kitasatospora sp. NPDC007106 TaxID=3156914 RepID=UPI0033FE16DC